MKRVFVDSDVCLDLLLVRQPFDVDAGRLFSHFTRERTKSHVAAPTFLNLHYFLRKQKGEREARIILERFRSEVVVLAVTEKCIQRALASKFSDFEDAVQEQCAVMHKMELIITRNIDDFKRSELPVLGPQRFLAGLKPPFNT